MPKKISFKIKLPKDWEPWDIRVYIFKKTKDYQKFLENEVPGVFDKNCQGSTLVYDDEKIISVFTAEDFSLECLAHEMSHISYFYSKSTGVPQSVAELYSKRGLKEEWRCWVLGFVMEEALFKIGKYFYIGFDKTKEMK